MCMHIYSLLFLSKPLLGALKEMSGLSKLICLCILGQIDHCCCLCNAIGKKGIALINRSSF